MRARGIGCPFSDIAGQSLRRISMQAKAAPPTVIDVAAIVLNPRPA
jgi:hypothetical protein